MATTPPSGPQPVTTKERTRVCTLIQTAAKAGRLDQNILKEIKNLAKSSADVVKLVFEQVMKHLGDRKNCRPRLVAVRLSHEMVLRSAQFRELLDAEFREFVKLAVGTDTQNALPPPDDVAQEMRQVVLEMIEQWDEVYGTRYKQFRLARRYLSESRRLKFPEIRSTVLTNRQLQQRREAERQRILNVKYSRIETELEEHENAITAILKQMDSCFNLIVPDLTTRPSSSGSSSSNAVSTPPSNAQPSTSSNQEGAKPGLHDADSDTDDAEQWETVPVDPSSSVVVNPLSSDSARSDNADEDMASDSGLEEEEDEYEEEEEEEGVHSETRPLTVHHVIRDMGLGSASYELMIEINKDLSQLKTTDNQILFENLTELYRELFGQFDPMTREWLRVLTQVHVPDQERRAHEKILKRVIDLRESIDMCKRKSQQLSITHRDARQPVSQQQQPQQQQQQQQVSSASSSNAMVVSSPVPAPHLHTVVNTARANSSGKSSGIIATAGGTTLQTRTQLDALISRGQKRRQQAASRASSSAPKRRKTV